MNLVVNGEHLDVDAGTTVADLVARYAPGRTSGFGIAVAVNGEVVPRSSWSNTRPNDSDRVELLAAAQGG